MMTNRAETAIQLATRRALEKARADLDRGARRDAAATLPGSAENLREIPPENLPDSRPGSRPGSAAAPGRTLASQAVLEQAATTLAARLDLLSARLEKARADSISALLFLGDAQQDCCALAEACEMAGWELTGQGVALLSDCLRRALPSEPRHLELIDLLIVALHALHRAESRPDMGRAGQDLMRGLQLATARELGGSSS